MSLTIGSLFSGIGGLELGLEWAGLGPVVWQVEQDEYCRAVLAKHWPHAERHEDVRHVGRSNLAPVGVICGGFPCQDVSDAGDRVGIGGERSGLWSEFARITDELRPRYVVVENVPGLLARGLGRVLGDLAAIGYDAEWQVLSAARVGAPHLRERVFVVAYPARIGWQQGRAESTGIERRSHATVSGGALSDTAEFRHYDGRWIGRACGCEEAGRPGKWITEPDVGRVAHGVPARVDRLRALGNAVVPQVAEIVGQVILAREAALQAGAA